MEPQTIKLVIFDVDDTLVTRQSGRPFRENAADWTWLPGRLARLAELRGQHMHVGIASNQGGVAFGKLEPVALVAELESMVLQAQIPLNALEFCFHHPHARLPEYRWDCPYRKPKPGMLFSLMHRITVLPQHTLMVGDRPEDQQAAKSAGATFQWTWDYFGEEPPVAGGHDAAIPGSV